MPQSKPESQNLENVERMKTESQYLFENITDQVVDKLLDDIDISKVSKYPSLKELGKDYAENPDKLKKDIDELSNSQNLLDREDRNILETIKEKIKKPLAVVCLLGVLMTGGAMNDGDKDSNIHQLANKLGINNVAHAEEEAPDWGAMNETLEEENEELKEENEELKEDNDKQEERIKQKKQRLEMLKEINKQLDEDIDKLDEDIDNLDEDIDELNKSVEETNKEFRNHIETFAEDIDNINDEKKQWSIEVLEKFDIFEDEEKTQDYLELFKNN